MYKCIREGVGRSGLGKARCVSHQGGQPLARPKVKGERGWTHPMMSIPVVCFALGTWQVFRRSRKLQLIEDINRKRDMEPIDYIPGAEYPEYTPIRVSGEFDYQHEFYLGPRHDIIDHGADRGNAGGYHSIVPMVTSTGERILVDRGWVQNRTDTPVGRVKGLVTVAGYVRHAEEPVTPLIAPAPIPGTYMYRDSADMAAIAGTLPITVELFSEYSVRGGPIAGQTRLELYNKHMEYIITWYGLGIASLYFIAALRRRPSAVPQVFK